MKFVFFVLFFFPRPTQIDYTKLGTCNLCYEKRENVSLAHEVCSCTVTFHLDEAFKVTLACS